MFASIRKLFDSNERKIKKYMEVVDQIDALEPRFSAMSDEELAAQTDRFKESYNQKGMSLEELLPEAFAVVREASKRVLDMRHFGVQLLGGMVLHDGDVAEMKTGEGKTLVATLPAYLNAITGEGVHIVTVNDYLVERDYEWMGKLFIFLGLTVGRNLPHFSKEEKKAAYASDITFGTNNEFGFDYLRDNMVLDNEDLVQRNLNFAIIDEADSILIDEARTPLIISGHGQATTDAYYVADKVVRTLSAEDDYTVDIKTKQVTLTESGVKKVEGFLGINNLYDIKNLDTNHHIQQALKAHVLMKKDQDYVVNEEGVVIVDEFTGRLMQGRRYSDGLHQAIEAKERLEVQSESMTLATVTLQNYFRLYKKLAGMTGTAKTEEEEFHKIYNMHVVQVPTNKSVIRIDFNDVLYRTEDAKYRAVVDEIVTRHEIGQPLLIGTVSIESSEKLSKLLRKKNITHEVLNAKNHAREAEIIAGAGKLGAVTIATNMAGRGTDIVLGEKVPSVGGLHVIGTERHESRRIDNQLRGRSGRQGDPGSSQFFLSFSDDLMRRFAPESMASLMDRLGIEEDQPIEGKMFTKAVSNAQKKVEGNNFDTRRWVLQYDDVLNQQREVIYNQRREVLTSTDLESMVMSMVKPVIERLVDAHTPEDADALEDWDNAPIVDFVEANLLPEGKLATSDLAKLDRDAKVDKIYDEVVKFYKEKKDSFDSQQFLMFCKIVILHAVDRKWMDHIDAMEHLRQGIHLRSYGQENPLRAYQFEGFAMFENMIQDIQLEAVKYVLKSSIQAEEQIEMHSSPVVIDSSDKMNKPKKSSRSNNPVLVVPVQKTKRNAPCPCGSGDKFKNCCLNKMGV